MNYVYILRCSDGTLYCGWTSDLEKRVSVHNAGTGAKYTRSRRPVELLYYEEYEDRHEALSREWHIKRMRREEKLKLINGGKKMEFKELIKERRSVRAYASAPTHEELVQILTEAQQAPSWKNSQTTRWYVAESPEKHEELRQALHPANQNKVANAAMIVSTYVRNVAGFTREEADNEVGNGWGAYDLGLHDAYLLLAARDAGYDTLIMGLRDGRKIREIFGIPENEEVLSVIAVGKRAEEPAFRPRKELAEIARFY